MFNRAWRNWGDHPVVVIIGLISIFMNFYTFTTGKNNICDLVNIGNNCSLDGTVELRYIGENSVNLRSQPTTESSVIVKLNQGTQLKVIKPISGSNYRLNKYHQGNDWYEVNFNGQKGYVVIYAVDINYQ